MSRKRKSKGFKNHPIFMYKTRILEKIKMNQVVIITGHTGCGKSTQVPKYLFESGYSTNGIIACLHPRCVAAKSLSARVSEELQDELGGLVGYHIRFERNFDETRSKIMFMTTGLMLMKLKEENCIGKYSVIIIDEAHERSIQTDIVMGMMKEILKRNEYIKLIIMSATLDVTQIQDYFVDCKIIDIKNTEDKVKVIYRPLKSDDYMSEIKRTVEEILKISQKGHILIFLQSEEKVLKCRKKLANLKLTKSLALFASMDNEEKERVFYDYRNRRKIIVSTNVAETSLTIPGVDYVIDSGLVKRVQYDYELGVEKWMTKKISIAEANQRKGRTGRTGPGTCYRLYDEKCIQEPDSNKIFNSDLNDLESIELLNLLNNCAIKDVTEPKTLKMEHFSKFPPPEIEIDNLSWMILTLKAMGYDNVLDFPFILKPNVSHVEKSIKELVDLSLLTETLSLTKLGKNASSLPLEPSLAKIALIGSQFPCREDVNKIIAMLCVRNVLKSPIESRQIHLEYFSDHGDLFMLLNIFNEAEAHRFSRQWCAENSIDYSGLKYASRVYQQIRYLLFHLAPEKLFSGISNDNMVKKVFLSGFFKSIARQIESEKLATIDDKQVGLSKTSCLKKTEELIMYHTIQKPSEKDELVIRNCTSLNKQMLKDLKPQKYKIKAQCWKSIADKILVS